MNWSLVPIVDYVDAVDALLKSRHGIDTTDVDAEQVADCRDDGWSPEHCVEWIGTKYNLDRIDTGPYGGIEPCSRRSPTTSDPGTRGCIS
ncbi:MAG: hypothetical protein O3C69_03640 [Chloroflexi bacterium]|nr:hypothetical protein [Chloroflexota bacterium]